MATVNLDDATARHIGLGVDDQSAGSLPAEDIKMCQHVPLFYVFAPKGTTERFYGTGAEQELMFGSDAFDVKGSYSNHHIRLRNFLIENDAPNGGASVIQRLIPKDNLVKANITVWMDVLETMIPDYKRTSTGEYYKDPISSQLVLDKYIPGVLVKWYKSSSATPLTGNLGSVRQKQGSMARWTMEESETETHILTTDSTIETTATGLMDLANKTVYVYGTDEDRYNPKFGVTTRKMYTVDDAGNRTFGPEEQTFGVTDGVTTYSIAYPIFEVRAAELGSWYNLTGFSIESLQGTSVSTDILENNKHLPYNLYIYKRLKPNASPTIVKNVYGDTYSTFTFQKDSVNPLTQGENGFEFVVRTTIANEKDRTKNLIYKQFESIYFYRDNFNNILNIVNSKEIPNISQAPLEYEDGVSAINATWFDYASTEAEDMVDEYGLLNPFTCRSTKSVPYYSLRYNTSVPAVKVAEFEEINLTNNTPIFLQNGQDGTMTPEVFEELVREDLQNYSDPDSKYQDLGLSYETHLYDTGFEAETKNELSRFTHLRKDTNVIMCTHYASLNDKFLSTEEQRTLGSVLVGNAKLYPESDYYGTPAIRESVFIGTGSYNNNESRYPIIYEIAIKTAKLMGKTDFKWDGSQIFDRDPKNRIDYLYDLKPEFIPQSMRSNLKRAGLNYFQSGGPNEYFFPTLQTVYSNSTSICNSYINSLALGVLERVAWKVWRKLTGDIRMSAAAFADYGRSVASGMVTDIFSGILKVTTDFVITEADKERGYTWHLTYNVYGNVMKSVQIYTTRAFRTEMLESK